MYTLNHCRSKHTLNRMRTCTQFTITTKQMAAQSTDIFTVTEMQRYALYYLDIKYDHTWSLIKSLLVLDTSRPMSTKHTQIGRVLKLLNAMTSQGNKFGCHSRKIWKTLSTRKLKPILFKTVTDCKSHILKKIGLCHQLRACSTQALFLESKQIDQGKCFERYNKQKVVCG